MLELDDGTCITESVAICRYLESRYPEPKLFGRTPEETAVAIAGEIIAFRTGHAGGRLAERSGPIHASAPDMADSPDAADAEREAAGAARDPL